MISLSHEIVRLHNSVRPCLDKREIEIVSRLICSMDRIGLWSVCVNVTVNHEQKDRVGEYFYHVDQGSSISDWLA